MINSCSCQLIIVKTINVVSIEDGAIDHIFHRLAVPKLLYRELLPSLLHWYLVKSLCLLNTRIF